MLPKPLRILWGDLTEQEIKKFGILAGTFFLIIWVYWMLRVMKDASFDLLVGYEWQPIAKLVSLVTVAFAVIFYSKLIDMFKKHALFYIICSFYGLGFLFVAYAMTNPNVVSVAESSFIGRLFYWIPGKLFGWFSYAFLESFGALVPALFWSFVASTTTTESAKRGYGMIMSCAQVGTILGPLMVSQYSYRFGLSFLFGIGGVLVLLIPIVIKFYMYIVPEELLVGGVVEKEVKTGIFEGLRLLFAHSYLLGIFVVATVYEVIGTIIEYQFGMCIKQLYPARLDGGAAFALLNAWNGIAVGVVTLIFALFGTSYFMRKLGLTFCLIAFPIMIGCTVTGIFLYYYSGASLYQLMWTFFAAVVVLKCLNYALNNPTKEVMYIPTSKDVKFKAKGWIDGFGARSTKGIGALLTGFLGASLPVLLVFGSIVSLGIVSAWVVVAFLVGTKFNHLQQENKIIE